MSQHVVDEGTVELYKRSPGGVVRTERVPKEMIVPVVSIEQSIYHTQDYHCEWRVGYPGQLDPYPPTVGLFGFSRFIWFIRSFAPINEITKQTN